MRRIFSVFIPPRSNRAFPVPNHHHYGPGCTRSSLGNNAGMVVYGLLDHLMELLYNTLHSHSLQTVLQRNYDSMLARK